MPDSTILTIIDLAADLSADVQAVRGWLARAYAGYELGDRERAAIIRHLSAMRAGTDAVLLGVELLGLGPADDSPGGAGESLDRV
jgi:hypothetical protein